MRLQDRIEALVYLGEAMKIDGGEWDAIINQAKHKNPWFTQENCEQSIQAIAENYLDADTLSEVASHYDKLDREDAKRVGVVAAGNIPLVGIHDIIACFLAGHTAVIKLSEKDEVLIPHCIDIIVKKYPSASTYFEIVSRLENFYAVIATGSNNTSRYFEHYFSKHPNIIRKNRNALAVLSGKESKEELTEFGKDIFSYFGLGCRNVSMIFVPRGYKLEDLMSSFEQFSEIAYHNKYKNNLDYNGAIYLLNQEAHLISDFLVMREQKSLSSRIACLHYQFYDAIDEVETFLKENTNNIQCVVSHLNLENAKTFPFASIPEI